VIVFAAAVLFLSVFAPLAAGESPSFANDIVPILTRSGCANSNCHGSIRGQAGFKLSLFGYEPELDYDAIVKDANGRRIDRADPDRSLILAKPTFAIPHGGGERFKVGSLEYNGILEWIQSGAAFDTPGAPRLKELQVSPAEMLITGINSRASLSVAGAYTDGSIADLTKKVQYTANDESVIEVNAAGEIRALRAGETAIMVRTLGKAVAVRVAVVAQPPRANYPETPCTNFIDDLVVAKLKRINIVPSRLSSDHEFLRRVYLDTLGLLPSLEETHAFMEAKDPGKRARLIDTLLERPEFAEVWATRFSDLFRVGLLDQGNKGGRLIYNWIRKAIRDDKPYNEFVTELLTASGNLFYNPTANFYYVTEFAEPENYATNISQVFLGVRLECARCHNHPWEKWTQDDFWGFAGFFARMGVKDTYQNDESQIHLKLKGEVVHPKTKKPVAAKYLDGPAETEGPDEDIREKLAAWMTSPDNPWFARAIVNRIVKHYLGRGLVEPVDDFRVTNPPSNEALLDALATDFVRSGYSLRHTVRLILNSRAYQLSSEPNETNRDDEINYSRYPVKRLMAEQLIDAITQVTGLPEKYQGFPLGTRAMSIPRGAPSYFLQAFGRMKAREVICERDLQPAMNQAMHLISGDTLQRQITAKNSRLAQWLEDPSLSDEEILKRLFLTALVREPDSREISLALAPIRLGGPEARRQAFEDALWALFNSKEFAYNH
jgi:Protein of unknown function (DUF1553)/Protein of unknown function (DUF1549)